MKLPIGPGTITGIFGGIVLGLLLWLIAAGIDKAVDILPEGAAAAFFFIGLAAGVCTGYIADTVPKQS